MPKLNLRDASAEDAKARIDELRNDFVNMDEGRRSDPEDANIRSMIDEAQGLDNFFTIVAAQEHGEKLLAATSGSRAHDSGYRTIGEAFLTPELIAAADRDPFAEGGIFPAVTHSWANSDGSGAHDVVGQRSAIFEQTLKGDDGKRMMKWLKAAGSWGVEGLRAVEEWSAAGPPNFDVSDAGGLIPRLGQPIPPVPRQAKLYLRDLMPSMTTTFPIIPYVRELNPAAYEAVISGGATTVAEGSVKPTATLSFVSENAPVTVVATTLTLSKQMFADAPAVIAYINQRLPYLVKLREDQQFLSGSGTWPDMLGITNTPGLISYGGTNNNDYAVDIGNAFAKVENQDGMPTAVVMNPTDAWTMFIKRAAGGSGTFDAGTPFASLPLTVWGVPTYRSRVYPAGSALVCDFERGAMVVDREQVNLQTYNERYAEQNLVLLICEERLGIMIFRPDLFIETSLS